MPKFKTRKSILRRFRITKTGKVISGSSFSRHLRKAKNKSQIRRLKRGFRAEGKMAKKIKKILGG
ncbi:50S ribosomal protein L35 [Candidatus Shapirobacteria bacterium]|nr:50S ribosomal protein L35 [Candidatus Shapirobacteria bacterium]